VRSLWSELPRVLWSISGRCAMNAPESAPTTTRRSWLQFRLGSLIVVMVLCALAVTWWRQWKLTQKLSETQSRLDWEKSRAETMDAALDVIGVIDPTHPEHHRLLKAVERFRGPLFQSVQRHRITESTKEFEIILFQAPSLTIPGSNRVVAVILDEDRIIDHLIYTSSTREESCEATLKDVDGNGSFDVVIEGERGHMGMSKFEPFRVSYAVTKDGLGPEQTHTAASKVASEN
jgi:hypothetical protein